MEKFILLFRGSDVYDANQSPEALQLLTVKMLDWVGNLVKNGRHVSSEKLYRSGAQVSGTTKAINNIAFGAAKEVVGGCTIVLAKDISEAVEIAKACPILETDANIEIRPVQSV
ncbi:YciI family protein [Paraflavitalea soli]|nr:YciI family protein [Paraflavitalea soli]